jgi:hypothetical protein
MPTPIPPDVVDLTIKALLARPVTSTLVGTRVYGRIPGTPTFPLWIVTLIDDGEDDGTGKVVARVQVDAWGELTEAGEYLAAEHARNIKSLHRDLRGSYTGGRISNTGHLNTVPLPDPDTGRARFAVDLEITAHPS